jgi:hypothetical protein
VQYLYKSTSCHEFYGGYGHVYILSTSRFDGDLGSVPTFNESTSTATLDGCSLWHLFQQNRSIRLVYTQSVGWARMNCPLDYILSHCTQGSFVLAINTADPRRCPCLLPTSSVRLSGSYLTRGARSYEERP